VPESYLKCPQCGATTFWVEDEFGKQINFKVTSDGVPVSLKDPNWDISTLDFSLIHCLSCSWSGSPNQLKK
jgi:predicted nucleic-acid-binding Zn-ribbon protein